MKIVLAPDSFKGSLDAINIAKTMKKAILDMDGSFSVIMKPMADGGEGTLDAILTSADCEVRKVRCKGALGNDIETAYAITEDNEAIIELALIAGIVQVPEDKRNPDHTTTYGLGEVIKDALDQGCSSIVIGIGGSATNDGGLGMLLALGMEARDEDGNLLAGFGKDLHRLHQLSFDKMDPRIEDVKINVACDVDNPLYGNRGASVIFGPQKGATPEQVQEYDQSLEHFSKLVEQELGSSFGNVPGVGAAGGLGFGLYALGAELVSGAELLANTIHLEASIQDADLVFTGEGKSDEQTLFGKAPSYVAALAGKYNVPVILLSGSLDGNLQKLRDAFSGCFSIVNKPMTLKECMEQAESLLYEQTQQIMHYTMSMR